MLFISFFYGKIKLSEFLPSQKRWTEPTEGIRSNLPAGRAGPGGGAENCSEIVLKLFIFFVDLPILECYYLLTIIYLGKSINFNIVISINFMNLYVLKGGKHYGNH